MYSIPYLSQNVNYYADSMSIYLFSLAPPYPPVLQAEDVSSFYSIPWDNVKEQ
jgi:hypothetical protein